MSISGPTARFAEREDAYRAAIVGATDGVTRQLRAPVLDDVPALS